MGKSGSWCRDWESRERLPGLAGGGAHCLALFILLHILDLHTDGGFFVVHRFQNLLGVLLTEAALLLLLLLLILLLVLLILLLLLLILLVFVLVLLILVLVLLVLVLVFVLVLILLLLLLLQLPQTQILAGLVVFGVAPESIFVHLDG